MRLFSKLSIVCGLFLPSAVLAAPLTPEQAIQRVITDSPRVIKNANVISSRQPIADISLDSSPALYLFNSNEGGFLIVSGDDKAPALLGYSDTGAIDADREKWPAGFRYWMEKLAEEIEWMRTHPSDQKDNKGIRPERKPVSPLCKTKWNQTDPYNRLCPKLPAAQCPTGCAATAMAQIMKYHNWPEQGEGNISFYWKNGKKNLSEDFSGVRFDWKNMKDSYLPGEFTDKEATAVAQLMKSDGYSIEMMYGATSSGAFALNIPNALGTYFRYDKASLEYLRRDFYTLFEWEERIYDSLINDGPVNYNGMSNAGGHSFVCDGYSSDGYFHFNWGWGGDSDGYFLLDALDPGIQGTGGSGDGSGFNYSQDVIIGIHPDKTGASTWADPRIYPYEPYDVSVEKNVLSFPVYGNNNKKIARIVNYSCITLEASKWNFGVRLISTDERADTLYYTAGEMPKLARFKGDQLGDMAMPPVSLTTPPTDGDYKLIPCYKVEDGVWMEIPDMVGYPRDFVISFAVGKASVSSLKPELEISDIELSRIQLESMFNVTGHILNKGEAPFIGKIVATLYSLSGKNLMFEGQPLNIEIGEKQEMELNYCIDLHSSRLGAGAYLFGLCRKIDDELIPIIEREQVMVYNATPLAATVTDIDFADNQLREELHVSGVLNVEKGFFGGPIILVIADCQDENELARFSSENLFVEKGVSRFFSMDFAFNSGEPSQQYLYAFFDYDGNRLTEFMPFRLGGISAVESTDVMAQEISEYYNLQGIKIPVPKPGEISIHRKGNKVSKIIP